MQAQKKVARAIAVLTKHHEVSMKLSNYFQNG